MRKLLGLAIALLALAATTLPVLADSIGPTP